MKKLVFSSALIFTISLVAIISAFSQSVIHPETLNMLNDFAITLNADPSDINKDGIVDDNDKEVAKRCYAVALQYSDIIPDNIKKKLDWDRDGKVSGPDLASVTDNISRTMALNSRINNPVLNFISLPNVHYLFLGGAGVTIDKDNIQEFEALNDSDIYQEPIINKAMYPSPYYVKTNTINREAQAVFCDVKALADSVDSPDFKIGAAADNDILDMGEWLTEYRSKIAYKTRSSGRYDRVRSLNMEEASASNDFDLIFATAMDFVNDTKRSQAFRFTGWRINKDGGVAFYFESDDPNGLNGCYTTLEVIILGDTVPNGGPPPGKSQALHIQKILRTFNKNDILIARVTEGKIYSDIKKKHLIESYTGTATQIDSNGKVREESVVGQIFGDTGNVISEYNTLNQYDAAGVQTSGESVLKIYSAGSTNSIEVHVEYCFNSQGKITATNVYDSQGNLIAALSGSGKKELLSITKDYDKSAGLRAGLKRPEQEHNGLDQNAPELFQKKSVEAQVMANALNELFSGDMADEPNIDMIAGKISENNRKP